jgi:hypothetical protein
VRHANQKFRRSSKHAVHTVNPAAREALAQATKGWANVEVSCHGCNQVASENDFLQLSHLNSFNGLVNQSNEVASAKYASVKVDAPSRFPNGRGIQSRVVNAGDPEAIVAAANHHAGHDQHALDLRIVGEGNGSKGHRPGSGNSNLVYYLELGRVPFPSLGKFGNAVRPLGGKSLGLTPANQALISANKNRTVFWNQFQKGFT